MSLLSCLEMLQVIAMISKKDMKSFFFYNYI